MSMGHIHHEPLTLWTATVRARHVGAGPGFVQKYQRVRIERGLLRLPLVAFGFYVRAILFAGPKRLFFRVRPSASNARASVARGSGKPKRSRSSANVASGA